MPTLIADWSMYQSRFIGDPNIFADKYNPAKWVVDINFDDVAASEVEAVIIRAGLGQFKDPCFDRYHAGLQRIGKPWGIYHAYDPARAPVSQADLIRAWCPDAPPLGVFGDIEMGNAVFAAANTYLLALDARFGRTTGLYSADWFMGPHFSLVEQVSWRGRAAWFAGYPNLVTPAGWVGQPLEYHLHQFSEKAFMPGVARPTDMNRLNPALTLDDLLDDMQPALDHVVVDLSAATILTRVGLHGRADGRLQPADLQVVRDARIEAVKLMSTADPNDVDRLRALNPNILILVRCFMDLRDRFVSAQDFAHSLAGDLAPFYARGLRHFEVHNEPNLADEGLIVRDRAGSWADGAEFGAWFQAVVAQVAQSFPEALWGWPGLSPGDSIADTRESSERFLNQAGPVPGSADWIGIHAYWTNDAELQDAIDSVARYAQRFPGQTLYVTEFANPSASVAMAVKARQYLAFCAGMRRLPVGAAFAFVASASNPAFAAQAWRDEAGQLSAIPAIVGARSAQPARWWEAWPEGEITPSRRLAIPPGAITIFGGSGQPLSPPVSRQNAMDVWERQGDLLRVTQDPINGHLWWVRAADVQPE